MIEGTELLLYFGPHLIGRVSNTFYSEFNWYGTLHADEKIPHRVQEFIALCRDWSARLDAGQVPSADEFNDWRDIHDPGEWRVVAPNGRAEQIQAPVFWPDGDLCWRAANDADQAVASGRDK